MAKSSGLAGAAGTKAKRTRTAAGERLLLVDLEGGGTLELRIIGATVGGLTEGDFEKIQDAKLAMLPPGAAAKPIASPPVTREFDDKPMRRDPEAFDADAAAQ